MTPALEAELNRLGVIVRPVQPPKRNEPPVWKPTTPSEEPPW